ncbi:lipopolysaccharide biosynthesis protein [Geobacter anodireducens]|uniref:Oligosaccharide flippase family protein n=1 Tax=Geobacter anodireducens TaxID=1340425 RepID=A0ABR9NR51_9BACT|nr:oligosaccharide flippase family protein [Geobacter anodireducens]MBE2886749.1 oligosaccharide flippase family protein [Geobacter anodireducens]
MGIGSKIFKHTVIYSFGTILGKLISFLMLPFYANIFRTEGYGVIAMIDTSLGLFTIMFAGGVHTAITRIYHEHSRETQCLVLGTAIRIVWIVGAIAVTLPLIFSKTISNVLLGSQQYYTLFCIALITFVIEVAGQSASTILIIRQKSIAFSSVELIRLIIGVTFNILLVIMMDIGLIGIFISSFLSTAMSAAIYHILSFKESGLGFDGKIALELLRFQLPLIPGELIAFLGRQAERVIVRIMLGLEGMGVLEMAYKFPPLLNLLIVIPFTRAWRTKCIEIADREGSQDVIGRMFTNFLFVVIFAGLLLAVTIPYLLEVMTPAEFWNASRIAQIEILSTILAASSSYMVFGILIRQQTAVISIIKSALTPVKIILAFALIYAWGLAGAAYSALVIEVLTLIWISVKSQSFYSITLEYKKIGMIICGAAMIFVMLDGNNYTTSGPARYFKEHFLRPVLLCLQSSPLGDGKSGRLVRALMIKEDQLVAIIFNSAISSILWVLFPFVKQRRLVGSRMS